MGPRPVRKNGFQLPRSGDQQTVMICYPLVTLIFDGLLIWLEHNDIFTLLALLLPHFVMVVVVLSNWYTVESLNPEDNMSTPDGKQRYPGIRVVCFDQSMISTRYCASCRKQVYGLDHHCTWLNTCVGARNYVYFFALVVTGTCQMLYQSSLGVLYMTLWREDSPSIPESGTNLIVFYSLVSFFCFLSFFLTIAFGVLMVFHLYLLLWIRAGTYDWMMGNKSDSNSRAKARAQKHQYENAHRKQGTGTSGTDVRQGYITDTGDIEFTPQSVSKGLVKYDSDSSLDNMEHQSASGDDVSNRSRSSSSRSSSLASSRGTEELNEGEVGPLTDSHIEPEEEEEVDMESHNPTPLDDVDDGDDDHDPNVPTRDLTSSDIACDDMNMVITSENMADEEGENI